MVKGRSRGPAKAEFLVRFQVGALRPNPKRLRDPAVNRGCAGSTPAGHPLSVGRALGGGRGFEPRPSWLDTSTGCSLRPAMLDGTGTALVTRTKWVRAPPPAL